MFSIRNNPITSEQKLTPTTFFDRLNTLTILLANIFAVYLLLLRGVHFSQLIILYIFQAIIIIVINLFRILLLKDFVTDGFELNGVWNPTINRSTKLKSAFNMIFIFMMFEAVHLLIAANIALRFSDFSPVGQPYFTQLYHAIDWAWLAASLPLFILHHTLSFIPEIVYLRHLRGRAAPNIGKLTMLPIYRILFTHITIFVVMFLAFKQNETVVIVVVALKTAVDVLQHQARTGHA